jgi:hypothetical protein
MLSSITQAVEFSDAMFQIATVNSGSEHQQKRNCWLLELPGTALSHVQLDQRSLACTAVTCSTLRHAVPAAISKLEVRPFPAQAIASFFSWLEGHSSSLNSLTQCSIDCCHWAHRRPLMQTLPCPQLRELHLHYLDVQLAPSEDCPGVLYDL